MNFHDSILKGGAAKEIVKVILEKSGYLVYPYGYECTFSDVRNKLRKSAKNSRTVRRIKSSPDIRVYDDKNNDVFLVEIKMRTSKKPWIKHNQMKSYKEFWNDSILVLVTPQDYCFYAQRICELESKDEYDLSTDFLKFEEIFLRTNPNDIVHFKNEAKKFIERPSKASKIPINS
ncbi:MAG: hypothetical protein NUK62_09010 [Tenericutes bacterium]|nr:hypothetical protein [Mycoplasmatota bacterium]